ncbi:hypothetical protein MTR_5g098973 [Medicago truncatula]|uniref:Uncharacterized protein n=1 Tax=Medicago truncatula TaxID=3880 RepID=A0A072UFN0_MEDTR|nr:hypothetical protein MTR_5g098973 [Medicago truncatula]
MTKLNPRSIVKPYPGNNNSVTCATQRQLLCFIIKKGPLDVEIKCVGSSVFSELKQSKPVCLVKKTSLVQPAKYPKRNCTTLASNLQTPKNLSSDNKFHCPIPHAA